MPKNQTESSKKKPVQNILLTALIIICSIVFVICAYFIYQEISTYKVGEHEYTELTGTAIKDEGASPLRRVIDFEALKQTNSDIVGWIYIPDTIVDYPVTKTTDNDKYLDTLFSGKKNKAGTIFMDYRNKLGFSDDNTVLYGHNMKNDTMFHVLVEYANQDFYNAHKTAYYYTEDGVYELNIFSIYTAKATDPYIRTNYGTAKEGELKSLAAKSTVKTDVNIKGDENIMTFSTCTYEFDDARFVVHATVNKKPFGGEKE